ncbi:MAG TPA: M23 family metallopeptidase, partial [Flexilinea sp.]|nr:M23 family metallopeptidase [Flexilinea sp.]
PGTWLIVPGGSREFTNWSAPFITRENPAVASIYGPGACQSVMDGPVGSGVFIWPTTETRISGYNYSEETNHRAIDIAGSTGNAVYASDAGVVVYAGWNDWGYGNVVMIDHGNGWQTLYAHLDSYNVQCGYYVAAGDVIGAVGTTGNSSGPHLHFEMRYNGIPQNPNNFFNK